MSVGERQVEECYLYSGAKTMQTQEGPGGLNYNNLQQIATKIAN